MINYSNVGRCWSVDNAESFDHMLHSTLEYVASGALYKAMRDQNLGKVKLKQLELLFYRILVWRAGFGPNSRNYEWSNKDTIQK